MEKITADTVREMITLKPEITVEEFIENLKNRWLEHVDLTYDREISVVIKEYKDLVKKVVNTAKNTPNGVCN